MNHLIKNILIVLFIAFETYGQSNNLSNSDFLENYLVNIKNLKFENASKLLEKEKGEIVKYLNHYTVLVEDNGYTDSLSILTEINKYEIEEDHDTKEYIIQVIVKGYYLFLYRKDRIEAFNYFQEAYEKAKKIDYPELEKLSLRLILEVYKKGILQANGDYNFFLEELENTCIDTSDWLYYYNLKFNLLSQEETYDNIKSKNQKKFDSIFIKYDSIKDKLNSSSLKLKSLYYVDKANYLIRRQPKKAKELFLEALKYLGDENYFLYRKKVIYFNLYRSSYLLKEYDEGFKYLKLVKGFFNKKDSLRNYYQLYSYKAELFNGLKESDSAFKYERKAKLLVINLKAQDHNIEISKIRERLKTAEKDKQILEEQQKTSWFKNLLIGTLFFILFSGTIGYLNLKNSRKKRLIALQEKELETQKNLTLLKEQEITTINAMVAGQEKERKRVAEDLHDNLGSVIATLKLHFDNLRINRKEQKIDQEILFDKTENLIDDAYKKVRSIAHAKNAGVIANQGLLVAVQTMTKKIADANKIQIEVIHFGLEKPIENSLEIALFRIIQELTTNILKHAQATEATINISQDQKEIVIIVEDNGKGMEVSQIDMQKGMGLHSIKTRVEHLKGSFTIDSTPTKGTTMIINIPTSRELNP